jgi:hypothetical protein
LKKEHRFRLVERYGLRKIFGHKREIMMVKWIKLRNEDLLNLKSLLNLVNVIKSKPTKWVTHDNAWERRDI